MKKSWLAAVLVLGGLFVILLAIRVGRTPSRPAQGPTTPPAKQAQKPEAPSQPPVPIGKEREAKDWEADVTTLLVSRRTTSSDLVGGLGGIAYDPSKCKACHGNPSPVGLVFYGPENKDFAKDQWLQMLGRPEKGEAPARDYNWIEQHKSRVELRYGVFPESQLRQNP